MKYLLPFILLGFIQSAYGQEIELQGCYTASFMGSETIEFKGKDSFYFKGFYCTYLAQGRGRCEIRNDFLYLFFEKSSTYTSSQLTKLILIAKAPSIDTSSINISIVNYNYIPLPFSSIVIQSENAGKFTVIADPLGRAKLQITNSQLPITITTSALGQEQGYIKIEEVANYTFQFIDRENSFEKTLDHGEVWVYEIDELTDDYIVMRLLKSTGGFRKYTRKP